jgi:hypothetical protein
MSFERPTLEELIAQSDADIATRLEGADTQTRRSNLAVLSRVNAGAVYGHYGYHDFMARQLMPDTAESAYLDRWAGGAAQAGRAGRLGHQVHQGRGSGQGHRGGHREALSVAALQQGPGRGLDLDRLRAIEALTTVPLVIHGGSGVPRRQRATLAATSRIAKFNIGTELRMAFGAGLRAAISRDPACLDRIAILRATEATVFDAARAVLRDLGASGRA